MAVRVASLLLLFAMLASALASGAVVSWLYDVSVPVSDQSQSELRSATRSALLEMLSRATGLAEVPRNDAVREALADPGRYYVQYRYEQRETAAGRELELVVSFGPSAITRLLSTAALPLWSANRPTVVAWLVVEDAQGQRTILDAGSDNVVLTGLEDQARRRGVPLVVPVMDLDDQFAVPAAAVYGGISPVLEEASQRYGADALLIGKIRQDTDEAWAVAWEFWMRESERQLVVTNPDGARAGASGADLMAEEMAVRYAVYGDKSGILQLEISAVRSLADYGGVLEYLDALEFVDSVQVRMVTPDAIRLDLVTPTEWQRFLELLALDGRLTPVPGPVGADRHQLAWRGASDDRR